MLRILDYSLAGQTSVLIGSAAESTGERRASRPSSGSAAPPASTTLVAKKIASFCEPNKKRGCYTFCVRKLIVNADDLGLTAGVNRAIIETHIGGVVSSATLMANGGAFEDAVTAARSAPNLSVGCHVVLVDGAPV